MQWTRVWVCAVRCALVGALAGCASGGSGGSAGGDDSMVVRGALAYRERVALPADSVAVVELTRQPDGRVIAEQRIDLAGRQVPIPFELSVRRSWLKDDARYALRGAIRVRNQPVWVTEPVDVRPARGVVETGAMLLRPWDAVAFTSKLECGARVARIGIVKRADGFATRMTVDGERFEMNGVADGSATRYEAAGDPTTQLLVRGDRATLTLKGERLPECVVRRDAPDLVTAGGTEPSWRLELGAMLRFSADDLQLDGTAPPAQYVAGTRRHNGTVNGRPVSVTLTDRVCRDSMSGMPHPLVAEVTVSGRTFRGCGGEPDSLLLGAEWVVESIDGRAVVERSRATLDFGVDGRLAGRATCNAYTTSYTLTGETLTVGTTASTMSSCPPPLQAQERLFLDVLQGTRQFDIADDGALVLIDERGRRIVARRPRGS